VSSNPLNYRITEVETIKQQTRVMYGCRSKSVRADLHCGLDCTLLSLSDAQPCWSSSMRLVTLYKCCVFTFILYYYLAIWLSEPPVCFIELTYCVMCHKSLLESVVLAFIRFIAIIQ